MKKSIAANVNSDLLILKRTCLLLGLLIAFSTASWAQTTGRQTDYTSDQLLRGGGRVNPSTLAMELSIPIGGFTGRAGNNKPFTLNYSSKVWQIRYTTDLTSHLGEPITNNDATFARHSSAGWTTTLGSPWIDWTVDLYCTDSGNICNTVGEPYPHLSYVKRLRVEMPDGSTHEFRKSDSLTPCANSPGCEPEVDRTGTFLSVDGTRMRLEMSASPITLYMPDGSRYLFGPAPYQYIAHTLIDPDGNRSTYNASTNTWTDTMGRSLPDPLPVVGSFNPQPSEGTQVVTYPGLDGGTQQSELKWERLGTQISNLPYTSPVFCVGQGVAFIPSGSPYLFNNSLPNRVCAATVPFNPVVLTEIKLPNNTKYEFSYNMYGEIIRVDLPTGGYEHFEYRHILPISSSNHSEYEQANRGVWKHWISSDGTAASELEWRFETVPAQTNYTIKTFRPDGTRSEQVLHSEWLDYYDVVPFGFGDPKIGRAFEERLYSSAGFLMRRKLTEWTHTGPLTIDGQAGYTLAKRDARPKREIEIVFEPGTNSALAAMSEILYETPGENGAPSDAKYFAALDPRQTKSYNYVVLDLGTAQTANVTTVATAFPSSALAIISERDHLYDANYQARNILALVTETRLKDGTGTVKAKNQISYDEGGYSMLSSGSMPAPAANSWLDPLVELGATLGSKRGLATSARAYSNVDLNQYVETHSFYDQFGNIRQVRDGRGNDTVTEYSPTFAFAYPTLVRTPIPDPTPSQNPDQLPHGSQTAFETTANYDFNTGVRLSNMDPNGLETRVEYDPLTLRPRFKRGFYANNQVGSTTEIIYNDQPNNLSVKTKSQIDTEKWFETIAYFDGLGRAFRTVETDSRGNIEVKKELDAEGRVKRVSNPYRIDPSGNPVEPVYWTTNVYDEASRVKEVVFTDTSKVITDYGISISGTLGITKQITDQAGKTRKGISDALGRMIRVVEDPTGQALNTDYVFDALGNLRKTTQGAQSRYFMHDSLGRLLFARQPEQDVNTAFVATDPTTNNTQWSAKYEYDNNGNLTKTTDARGIFIQGTYDKLNRLIFRDFSDPTTPDVSFYFDGRYLDANDVLQTASGSAKGKSTGIKSSVTKSNYTSFDNLGRLAAHQQITDGSTYNTSYAYNLSGAMVEETYPSGRTVKTVLNQDGDLSRLLSKKTATQGLVTYADGFEYDSAGAVTKLQLGNGRWETALYNNRSQITQIGLGATSGAQDLLKLEYNYTTPSTADNNGSLREQKITVPSAGGSAGFTAIQAYTYDNLNRLFSAAETIGGGQTWKQTFATDMYGNRRFDPANTTTIGGCAAAICNPDISTGNNRFSLAQGYVYDPNGNLTADAEGKRFSYDGENRQKEFFDQTNQSQVPDATYFYDGNGKRVKTVTATGTTIFVYNGSGQLVAEYSTGLATVQQVSYLTADNLGSPRVVTNEKGAVTERKDYSPYGEETVSPQRTGTLGYPTVEELRKGYTGFEEDDESGLNFAQARYYNPAHGRFTSADPLTASMSIRNPQTFNRYTYVLNSPYQFTDTLGLMSQSLGCSAQYSTCDNDGIPLDPDAAAAAELYRTTIALLDARRAARNGDWDKFWQILRDNKSLQALDRAGNEVQDPNEPQVEVTATVNSPVDNTTPGGASGIEVIIWDSYISANPLDVSQHGHVSYIIDGVSYSFDNKGYHPQKPEDYLKERRQTSGATGYVLDFGSPELNQKFKDSITKAYKNADGSTQWWTPTNNCGYAFKAAINSIAGDLKIAANSAVLPPSHGRYIQTTLKSYTKNVNTYPYIKGSGTLK